MSQDTYRLNKLRNLAAEIVDPGMNSEEHWAGIEALSAYLDYLSEAEDEEREATARENVTVINIPKFNVSAGTVSTPMNAGAPAWAPDLHDRQGGSH